MLVFFSVSLAIFSISLARAIYAAYRASCLEKETGMFDRRRRGEVITLRYHGVVKWALLAVVSLFSGFVIVMVVAGVNVASLSMALWIPTASC